MHKKRVLKIAENPFGNRTRWALWRQVGHCEGRLLQDGNGAEWVVLRLNMTWIAACKVSSLCCVWVANGWRWWRGIGVRRLKRKRRWDILGLTESQTQMASRRSNYATKVSSVKLSGNGKDEMNLHLIEMIIYILIKITFSFC